MEPIYFADRFGWLHRASGTRGVVLCNAGEVEQLNVHRHWGLLARRLAAAGIPTLRFDYTATGDSAGDDDQAGLVERWIADIGDAVACLREMTGVKEVVLVGLRLGGLLATVAATRLQDIDGLVLAGAPISGRQYLREMRALAAMIDMEYPATVKVATSGIETAGFRLSKETSADLEKLDLAKLAIRPAPRILLVARGNGKSDRDLAARLAGLGADVETMPFQGYSELIQTSVDSLAPEEVWARIIDWAGQSMTKDATATAKQARLGPALMHTSHELETPLQFSNDHPLFGVLSEPVAQPIDMDRPLVVFLNTGLDHHIGGGRMAVRIGRWLAQKGISSFRLDTREIGDSISGVQTPRGAEGLVHKKEPVRDLRAALDQLTARGYRRFVLFGICSGAYLSLHATTEDHRVVGQLIGNLAHFEWPEGLSLDEARRVSVRPKEVILANLRRPDKWLRILTGKRRITDVIRSELQRLRIRLKIELTALADRVGLDHLIQNEPTIWFRDFSKRKVHSRLMFSGGDPGLRQVEKDVGVRGRRICRDGMAKLEVIEGANHAMHDRWTQEALQQVLLDLIDAIGPSEAPSLQKSVTATAPYVGAKDRDMSLSSSVRTAD
ncbi:Serine aminopeptidase, S33 [Arboricoccus pini]|uniref:Serine aminopeptidase, S33 n=1 Tax=Arboricoccus pini TaxID=1963835 RepID=A0A212RS57_9PROT|nr:alpha/beta hydrolase [Arboricoccus pini]SNB75491.1 Serine aminopeptidase, S33 [Arboricoccus pini]